MIKALFASVIEIKERNAEAKVESGLKQAMDKKVIE